MYVSAPFALRAMPSRLFAVKKLSRSVRRSRILSGDLFADIIEDSRTDPQIVFCVVQRQGSPQVLFLSQFYTRSEAETAAHHYISALREKAA